MAKRQPRDTPLMQQFLEVKARHPDAVVFFRLGDFYEMFFEDAVLCAELLDVTLTSRNKKDKDSIPMCGVPHHSARGYIAKLTHLGHKVALCEQVGDPKKSKGLVKREVVRIITPGVRIDENLLDPSAPNYVCALCFDAASDSKGRSSGGTVIGVAFLDASTGEFRCMQIEGKSPASSRQQIRRLLSVYGPQEVVVPKIASQGGPSRHAKIVKQVIGSFDASLCVSTFAGELDATAARDFLYQELAADDTSLPVTDIQAHAAALCLWYVQTTQPACSLPTTRLVVSTLAESLVLDGPAISNLELLQTIRGGEKKGSLLSVLDCTKSAPGARMLRFCLLHPLMDPEKIVCRQDAVGWLMSNSSVRQDIRSHLAGVSDVDRLVSRVQLGVATPRDLARLRDTLLRIPSIATKTQVANSDLLHVDTAEVTLCQSLATELASALIDSPSQPTAAGGFVKPGYCSIVDSASELASGGKQTLAQLEERERKATGITNLRIKYNRVFGYYLEVTKSQVHKVPDQYVRKQTIATGERYVTEELAGLEQKLLAAQEKRLHRELEIFEELCQRIRTHTKDLQTLANKIARIDFLCSLGEISHKQRYVRPIIADTPVLDIQKGRHPVVEAILPAGQFVPNDCHMDASRRQVLILTGPNMAGKSTYMRQTALIILMAQMGCFVPADAATIGIVDRVFTRVGASDDVTAGESTFMVEMRETATILSEATARSFVILDEVGRGTSTMDGLSIAWAVVEYMHDAIGAQTLFATHYHELCEMAQKMARVVNVSMEVARSGKKIAFLHSVVEGGTNHSYGIEVARLAGLPRSVLARAEKLVRRLGVPSQPKNSAQMTIAWEATDSSGYSFGPDGEDSAACDTDRVNLEKIQEYQDIKQDILAFDPNQMTPIEALQAIAGLRDRLVE